MEPEEDTKSKKLNDDTVIFLRKRSETEASRYAARLRTYDDLHRKRSRAECARRRSEHAERKVSASRKKGEPEQREKNPDNTINTTNAARRSTHGLSCEHTGQDDDRISRRRGGDKAGPGRRSRSVEPTDRCGRRRRKRRSCSRRRRRRRRRSCKRRKRRRRSCRRRRRRSSSRRRRRRSCKRRRKRRRRGCR